MWYYLQKESGIRPKIGKINEKLPLLFHRNSSEMEKKLLSDFCDEESLIGDGLSAIGVGEWDTVKNFMIKVRFALNF